MLDVHAPHETPHSWKDFFIHIATIVIGLFIAVGLEQTVEFFHHRHLRNQLEEQMLEVFAGDVSSDAQSLRILHNLRAYLAEARASVIARLAGEQSPAPPATDARMSAFTVFPTLAPYDAAKENGTVAYLPTARIRIYNRVGFQRELMAATRDHWFDGLAQLAAFSERFTDSPGNAEMGGVSAAPDLVRLSRAELGEYLALLAAAIKKTDLMVDRYQLFDRECVAILDGARDEEEMLMMVRRGLAKPAGLGSATPT